MAKNEREYKHYLQQQPQNMYEHFTTFCILAFSEETRSGIAHKSVPC